MELKTERVRLFGATAGQVSKLLARAFPPAEQAPFPLLALLAKRAGVDFLAFFDDEVFCGFTYLVVRGDITHVMFFAVSDEHRSRGYGSAMLNMVKRAYPCNTVVLEIESLSALSENHEQRIRRRDFYLRNGFRDQGMSMLDNAVLYDVLVCGRDVSKEELLMVMDWFSFGTQRLDISDC